MGSFTKKLGQLAARSLETEGANILKTSRANKRPGSLAMALDKTLKDGHDMRIFGLGTAAALANVSRYGRFTVAMHAVYSEMEAQLDRSAGPVMNRVWQHHGDILRRSQALAADLQDVGIDPCTAVLTSGTKRYVQAIRDCGETHTGAGLLGHLYCRYFADLFGGQMLGRPTQLALGLAVAPRHYVFDIDQIGRREYIEAVYQSLNEAGDEMSNAHREAAVQAAYDAFRHNAIVYNEEPRLWTDATRGVFNMVGGLVQSVASPKA